MLPTYRHSLRNHATNIDVLKEAIRTLLGLLKTWELEASRHQESLGSLELLLDACCDIEPCEGPAEFHFEVLKSSANSSFIPNEEL